MLVAAPGEWQHQTRTGLELLLPCSLPSDGVSRGDGNDPTPHALGRPGAL